MAVAYSLDPPRFAGLNVYRLIAGCLAVCLVSSSNYVLNEILDAAHDRLHPFKRSRPVARGAVSVRLAYLEWLLLFAAGIGLGLFVSQTFALAAGGLWMAGCLYNIPPLRTKDVPYLDVVSEAVNNPIRMLLGWYLTETAALPITSLLTSYWMLGCYFMAIKRYSELRELGPTDLAPYRRSFRYYTERGLLASVMFYAANGLLFLGAFVARYRLELALAFPLVAAVMAAYLWLAFEPNSPTQHPESLYKHPLILWTTVACAGMMLTLLFVDVPFLHAVFQASRPGL